MGQNMAKEREEAFADVEYLSRIQSKYHTLTKKQKALAKFFLENAEQIGHLSISQVAAKAQTQPSSITRFCYALGYKGFSEYKFHLTRQLLTPSAFSEEIRLKDTLPVITQKLLHMNTEAIAETLNGIDEQTLSLSALALLSAKQIFLFGQGGPHASIDFAQHLLLQVGVISQAISDSSTMLIAAALLKKNDVAMIISFSGETAPIVEAASIARQNGAKIIAITAHPASAIARMANHHFCYSRNIPDDLFYLHISRICEILTVSLLQTYIRKHTSDLSYLPKITDAITKNRSRRRAPSEGE